MFGAQHSGWAVLLGEGQPRRAIERPASLGRTNLLHESVSADQLLDCACPVLCVSLRAINRD